MKRYERALLNSRLPILSLVMSFSLVDEQDVDLTVCVVIGRGDETNLGEH